MDTQLLERFKNEVNYDLEGRDAQISGYLEAAESVAMSYLAPAEGEHPEATEVFRQAVFVYARNLFDTGGQSEKGIPPAFYSLLNSLKQ